MLPTAGITSTPKTTQPKKKKHFSNGYTKNEILINPTKPTLS